MSQRAAYGVGDLALGVGGEEFAEEVEIDRRGLEGVEDGAAVRLGHAEDREGLLDEGIGEGARLVAGEVDADFFQRGDGVGGDRGAGVGGDSGGDDAQGAERFGFGF